MKTAGSIIMTMTRPNPCLTLLLAALLPAAALAWEKDKPATPPVMPPNPNNLPKVLLIGDSISAGYYPAVAKALEGKAVVAKSSDNGESTAVGVKKIDGWLGDTKWDVIHFNWGVWDMYGWQYASDDRTPAAYARRLETLVTRMEKTGAKLIWATTTPVPPKAESTMLKRWKTEVVISPDLERKYRDAAMQVMKKHGVQVDDLYALLKPRQSEFQKDDNVHFSPVGSGLMAKQVAGSVMQALGGGPAAVPAPPAGPVPSLLVKHGDKIAFMGDSITANGAGKNGYVTWVTAALNQEGLEVVAIPAGKAGHKSNDMLARMDADVISKNPQWMTLSCGVNDVWHFKLHLGKRTFQGVSLEDYKKNITAMLDKARAAHIRVMILTSTMIGEDPASELNRNLIPYNDFLRQIARDYHCPLADLNRDMQEALKKIPDVKGRAKMFGDPGYARDIQNKLTVDGCHMNARGNAMMAKGVLKAFGMSDDQIAAAEKSWSDKK